MIMYNEQYLHKIKVSILEVKLKERMDEYNYKIYMHNVRNKERNRRVSDN